MPKMKNYETSPDIKVKYLEEPVPIEAPKASRLYYYYY